MGWTRTTKVVRVGGSMTELDAGGLSGRRTMNGMGDWHRRRARACILAKKFRRAWLDAFRATLRLRPLLAVCDAKRLCAHQPALVPFLVGRLIGARRGIFLSCFKAFYFWPSAVMDVGLRLGGTDPLHPVLRGWWVGTCLAMQLSVSRGLRRQMGMVCCVRGRIVWDCGDGYALD